jgi:ABC-2 type transport system permease protein
MQVFKLGLMILKKKTPVLRFYVVSFLSVLSIAAVNYAKAPQQAVYSTQRFAIAFLTRDNGPVIDGLKESLSHTVNFVVLEDEPQALQDALFFNAVSAVLRIPEGFEQDLLAGGTPIIEKMTPPNALSGMNLDLLVDQYLQTIRLYAAANPEMPVQQMVDNTLRDLAVTTPVTLHETEKGAATLSFSAYFFNYLSYVYLSVVILGIKALMVVCHNADLRQRNACSPIPSGRVSLQFFSVNLLFTFLVWLVTGAMFFLLSPDRRWSASLGFFYLNALLYAFCAASISYLVGISLKESSAVSAVSNVVALGTSFLCGVFVPQALLAEPVLRVAQFLPTYWYVRANNLLAETALATATQQTEFTHHLLIQAGFGVACFILALVAGKRRNLQAA